MNASGGRKFVTILLPPNFQNGLDIINEVDSDKFRLFLNRVAQDLQSNPDSNNPFTDDQEEKLLDSLKLDRKQLTLLIQSTVYILREAIYNVTAAEAFENELSQHLKLTEEKVAAFMYIWLKYAKGLLRSYKEKTIFSSKFEDVSWLVNIEVASDKTKEMFDVHSILQMKTKKSGGETSNVILDLDESALIKLFNAVEDIQESLDSLY